MAEHGPLLRAVVARLFPADTKDGDGIAFGALTYLERHLATHPGDRDSIAAALDALAGQGFAQLNPAEQDAALARHEREPWFMRLAELVAEGVYADPGNGGNPDAISWTMLDYRHGLPEGPSGPAPQPAPAPRHPRCCSCRRCQRSNNPTRDRPPSVHPAGR